MVFFSVRILVFELVNWVWAFVVAAPARIDEFHRLIEAVKTYLIILTFAMGDRERGVLVSDKSQEISRRSSASKVAKIG
jgi:hypothetical protein